MKRKAASLSAAGIVLVAGCAGGGAGSSRPPVSGPQSNQKISFALTIPRGAPQFVQSSKRRGAQSKTRTTVAIRNPKYVSPGIYNGYLVIKVYQNGQQAGADQKFTIGFGTGKDFQCYFIPPMYLTELCYNTVDVYAPVGTDTFYAETFDGSNHLLSISPGLYGSYGPAPQAYTMPYSGTVQIPTYAYAASFFIESPTPCVDPLTTFFHLADADGFSLTGPIANPVTVATGGGFSLAYLGSAIGTSLTLYDASSAFGIYTLTSGVTPGMSGTVSASTSAGSLPTNFSHLYGIDHTALVVSTSGISALGLYAGGGAAFTCGQVALYNLSGFPPVMATFTNPVAMTSDAMGSLSIVDEIGTHPTLDFVPGNDLLVSPGVGAVVQPVALSSTGGIDVAASSSTYKSYVLSSDGTIQAIDTTYSFQIPFTGAAFFGTTASGLTTPAGSSLAVLYTASQDSLFVTSYGGTSLVELDAANTGTPSMSSALLTSPPLSLLGSSVSSAVTTDGNTASVFFRAFDPVVHDVVVNCGAASLPCLMNTLTLGNISGTFAGTHTLAPLGAYGTILATQGGTLDQINESGLMVSGFFGPAGGATGTVVTSPDGAFIGVQQGGSFSFFAYSGNPSLGTLPGTAAVILNGPFDF